MEAIKYSQIYKKFTKGLSPKTKDIFERRFGVKTGEPETLESIGKRFGITRERVRQIEEAGFNFIRKHHGQELDQVSGQLAAYFEAKGGFKKEELALQELGGKRNKAYVLFLLALGDGKFTRVCAKKDYHYFWSTIPQAAARIKEKLNAMASELGNHGKLMDRQELATIVSKNHGVEGEQFVSYLEVSKKIQQNKEGKFGLIDWPEIKPRGVKDKAFLVFKQTGAPLHFRKLAQLIDELDYSQGKKTHPQTVHNELIKDNRFVLVGRGTYALKEWGYVPGTIKDIINKVLAEKPAQLTKDEVVKEVLNQRMVAKNTVLINLNNRKYFGKDSQGKYFLQQTQSA